MNSKKVFFFIHHHPKTHFICSTDIHVPFKIFSGVPVNLRIAKPGEIRTEYEEQLRKVI